MTNTPITNPSTQPPKKRKRPSSYNESDKSRKAEQPNKENETSPLVSTTPPFSPMMYNPHTGAQHAMGAYAPASSPLPPAMVQIHPHMMSVIPGSATAYYHPGFSPQLYPHYGSQHYPPTTKVVATPTQTSISPAGTRYNAILPRKDSEPSDPTNGSKTPNIQPKSTMPPPTPTIAYAPHPHMYHSVHPYVQISPQLPPNMVPMTPPSSAYMQPNLSPSLSPSFDSIDHSRRVSTSSSTIGTADQREQARKESHSAIERRRRERINDKILQLKQLIPSCADQDHLHKMSILQSAIDYIAYLKEVIEKQGGKDLLHGKLSIKTVRSMLPKEVEAFTGQFSVKERTSSYSIDSSSPSPAWSIKQPTEYVQQMDLGPALSSPIKDERADEEYEQSEYHSESGSSTSSKPGQKKKEGKLAESLPSPSERVSEEGYDSATPLKPSDLMNAPRQALQQKMDLNETAEPDVSDDVQEPPAGPEQCARSVQPQNESSMSVSQMLC